MDNARIQGGANYVETQGGYTGTGVRGHIYEGIEATHPDFTHTPINVRSGGGADDHGHCTSGCVAGNGTSAPHTNATPNAASRQCSARDSRHAAMMKQASAAARSAPTWMRSRSRSF